MPRPQYHALSAHDSPTRQLACSLLYEALYGRDMLLYSHVILHRTAGHRCAVWRPDGIAAALRLWHRVCGRPPTSQEWRHAARHGLPPAGTVRRYWRTLADAWEEALRDTHG